MACKHVDEFELRPPGPSQAVYKEDCTQCFDSVDDPSGLDVCLHCFNGGCTGEKNHSMLHSTCLNHPLAFNVRRSRRNLQRDEPPQKISKIAIAAETEADRYEYKTFVKCFTCNLENVDKTASRLAAVIQGIMEANSFSRNEEVKAWEQVYTTCEHILTLVQESARQIQSQDLGICSLCDLHENLWLCLQCGNLGCGRAQFGGLKGHSHGLEHKNQSGHAVAVKLGSITPEGTADVYCYSCDEERIDDNLGDHLENWGIVLAERRKTEKSLTEMQIDENLRWEFSMTDDHGHELKRLYGEGFTGLKNLGNSCYLASSLQCLFALPQFQKRYFLPKDTHFVQEPAQDLETQLRKLGDGLLSGRYSHPSIHSHTISDSTYQKGLAPSMLKSLVGKNHPEFCTMRQQDAFEFIIHLFKLITRSPHKTPLEDPVKAFRFIMEQRLQCLNCKKVRYRRDEQDNISIPVPVRKITSSFGSTSSGKDNADVYEPVLLKQCLDSFTSEEIVELTCSSCGSNSGFSKRSLFKTFPEVLMINARRFVILNWVPTKVDVPVVVGDEPFLLDEYKSYGLQPCEELLTDVEEVRPTFTPNEESLQQLESMGFSRNRCERALHATGNSDVAAAMEWLFAHLDDADIDLPLELEHFEPLRDLGEPDSEKIEALAAMGFSQQQARKALCETSDSLERAVEWLFSHPEDTGETELSQPGTDPGTTAIENLEARCGDLPAQFQLHSIICHKGASTHSGHYVAFVRRQIPESQSHAWVLYNDEKVVQALDAEEMKRFAYVYLFQRT